MKRLIHTYWIASTILYLSRNISEKCRVEKLEQMYKKLSGHSIADRATVGRSIVTCSGNAGFNFMDVCEFNIEHIHE